MTPEELAERGLRVKKLKWQEAIGLPWLIPPTITVVPNGCILVFCDGAAPEVKP